MEPKPKTYRCRIQRMDRTGDSTVATYDPEVAESVTVAQDELQAFMDDCIATHGEAPPVWARIGNGDFNLFDIATDDLTNVEEVVIHEPLCGG